MGLTQDQKTVTGYRLAGVEMPHLPRLPCLGSEDIELNMSYFDSISGNSEKLLSDP